MDTPAEAPARSTTPRGTHRLIERHKELDRAHLAMLGRRELPSAVRLMLSLRFVRTALACLFARQPERVALPVPPPEPGGLAVTLVGHATVMLTSPAARVLTDPCFAPHLWGLRRVAPAALASGDQAAVTLVLISHAHRDHLHLPSLRALPRTASVLAPAGCVDLIAPLGFAEVVGLEPGDTFEHQDLVITAVPARHDGRRGLFDPRWRGALGYLLKTPAVTVYYAGDTAYFSGFRELGRRHRPDVALLPISGYLPLSQRETHMSPLDAIEAWGELGAHLLIPVAHGAFPLGYEGITAPQAWLNQLAAERGARDRVRALGSGETCLVRRRA